MVTIGGHSKLSRLYSIVVKKEWRARGYGARARGYGTPMILVSAPVPLGQIGFYNLLGLGWGFGTKGLGTELDNYIYLQHLLEMYSYQMHLRLCFGFLQRWRGTCVKFRSTFFSPVLIAQCWIAAKLHDRRMPTSQNFVIFPARFSSLHWCQKYCSLYRLVHNSDPPRCFEHPRRFENQSSAYRTLQFLRDCCC